MSAVTGAGDDIERVRDVLNEGDCGDASSEQVAAALAALGWLQGRLASLEDAARPFAVGGEMTATAEDLGSRP